MAAPLSAVETREHSHHPQPHHAPIPVADPDVDSQVKWCTVAFCALHADVSEGPYLALLRQVADNPFLLDDRDRDSLSHPLSHS
jgi:hypothetical protein